MLLILAGLIVKNGYSHNKPLPAEWLKDTIKVFQCEVLKKNECKCFLAMA